MEYLAEAIRVEKAGLQVPPSPSISDIPDELQTAFNEDPPFEQAFYALTPGRQRGYIIYFSQAKQSQTRVNRIDKYRSQILSGLGMQDAYRLSQKKYN
ncbi:YdeI/OmpD-associated family protein [Balneolaceae bacterium]|nr:YdeI/OmpD-associated family protein [Balneolaceae bacterium]